MHFENFTYNEDNLHVSKEALRANPTSEVDNHYAESSKALFHSAIIEEAQDEHQEQLEILILQN